MTLHSRPLQEALGALDCVDDITAGEDRSAQDQIMTIEGEVSDYLHSWYTEEEADAILREWRTTYGIGQTAIEGVS